VVYDDHTKFHENPSVKTLKRKTTRIKRFHKPILPHRKSLIFKSERSSERFKRVTYLRTLSGPSVKKRYICYGYMKEHNFGLKGLSGRSSVPFDMKQKTLRCVKIMLIGHGS
jgi:hypothetical protein